MVKTREYILGRIKEILRTGCTGNKGYFVRFAKARGDAHKDSDWDILILVDKSRLEPSDYDDIAYPLVEFGWTINECISPVMYTLKDWLKYSFTPFFIMLKKGN